LFKIPPVGIVGSETDSVLKTESVLYPVNFTQVWCGLVRDIFARYTCSQSLRFVLPAVMLNQTLAHNGQVTIHGTGFLLPGRNDGVFAKLRITDNRVGN